MSLIEFPSWSRPGAPERTGGEAARPRDASALSFILPPSSDRQRDSRRATLGLLALGVLLLALLNIGIYQAMLSGELQRTHDHLNSLTTYKRAYLKNHLLEVVRRARYLADDPSVHTAAWLATHGQLPAGRARELAAQLRRPLSALGFGGMVLWLDDRPVLTVPHGGRPEVSPAWAALSHEAVREGKVRVGDLIPNEAHELEMVVAAPVTVGDGHVASLMIRAPMHGADGQLMAEWPGLTGRASGYLVRREGDELEVLRLGSTLSQRFLAGNRSSRAAEIAAAGVEMDGEVEDATGRPLLICTRVVPGLGWNLVGEVPRSVVMGEMRMVIAGLLLMDLAVLGGGLVILGLWRRRVAASMAQREVEITRRHAERVQAVFDTAFDAILTYDQEGKIHTANRAAVQLLGCPAAELAGRPLRSCLRWTGGGAALPGPGTLPTAQALRPEGPPIPVEVSIGHAGEGEDQMFTAIVRDVRERVQAERQIRDFAESLEHSNRRLEELNAQLAEASRLKSEFLANTSHELRTPLNGMIGFLQLVLDDMCKDRDEEREFVKQALSCSRHLLGLINDVLDIAKIEAGKLNLEISQVDIESLFHEVYTLTHVQAAQKGIALRYVPPAEPVTVRADFHKTKQVLVNLVGNAIKFTEKGSITLKAIGHPDLGHVMFEVVDTGIGIPPDRQKAIFEKFIQADGSTTRRFGGTGLGLAISRSLVELMGGVIGVHSEGAGKGTRMYFSLPAWNQDPKAEEEIDLDQIQGHGEGALVLIVEDDAGFRRFLRTLLHAHGHRTLEARSAEQGWMLVRRHSPAVVVLDYALACAEDARLRTGWDLAERMATTAETRHIPLIFVTGFDTELRDKLHSIPFTRHPEHLTKPIDGAALLRKIEDVLGPREGRVMRVLLAEDDAAVVAYVRKVLPEERFQVEHARNGEECLHLLRTQPHAFDLLLLDLMMPEVSGYDVLREMVLTGTGQNIPLLVLTNFPEPRNEEERRLLQEGLVLDVLPKSEVHENPKLLAHLVDWHLQLGRDDREREAA